MRKNLLLFVLLLVSSFISLPAQGQSTCVVDRLTDTGEGEWPMGDLRFCITNAMSGDTITFEVMGTINLTGPLPDLNVSVTIEGPGADPLTVRRNTGGIYRIFTVSGDATVLISGLTIANGSANLGGGILNQGALTLSNSTLSQNRASSGGGIFNQGGTLTVSNSTVSQNEASFGSGGGGIFNQGELTVSNSTIASNTAPGGGGLYNSGTATVTSSTLSGNTARSEFYGVWGQGGALVNAGTATISNSTIWGNEAVCISSWERECEYEPPPTCAAGGIQNLGTLSMRNTICSDLCGGLASSGYNLIGWSGGGSGYDKTDLLDINPRVGLLQDNGGPTWTHALLDGSPAIDAGDNTDAPEFDQRGEGFPRIVNGIIDIGAFEFQGG